MSTVAKGNQFEDRVFDAIKHELASERLGLLPKACQIFKKKKYYSKIRKADIEIDISIEVFLPNMSSWSFLWAIECKDYKGALPVNDVEEFHAKCQG
ncbi:peptidase, partial [candidate division KSB1 bacterium]|nr:peptidase [candidate division KSB1 bacterium]